MQTAHTKPESLVLAIFGGSGDLTKRKLIPSLYQLFKQGKLPSASPSSASAVPPTTMPATARISTAPCSSI